MLNIFSYTYRLFVNLWRSVCSSSLLVLIRIFVVLLLSYKRSLHILDANLFYNFIVCQYSLPSYRFPFHSVDCFFCCAEVLKFEVVCLFLLLLSVLLVSHLRNHRQIQFHEVFPCISSRSFIGLTFIHFKLKFLYGVIWV